MKRDLNHDKDVFPILLLVIVLTVLGVIAYFVSSKVETIDSYQKCVDAGYPVMETYPERCSTPDGETFTRPLTDEEQRALDSLE